MQSFALGQWEPQTRLIPGVGILSAEKKKKKEKEIERSPVAHPEARDLGK